MGYAGGCNRLCRMLLDAHGLLYSECDHHQLVCGLAQPAVSCPCRYKRDGGLPHSVIYCDLYTEEKIRKPTSSSPSRCQLENSPCVSRGHTQAVNHGEE